MASSVFTLCPQDHICQPESLQSSPWHLPHLCRGHTLHWSFSPSFWRPSLYVPSSRARSMTPGSPDTCPALQKAGAPISQFLPAAYFCPNPGFVQAAPPTCSAPFPFTVPIPETSCPLRPGLDVSLQGFPPLEF